MLFNVQNSNNYTLANQALRLSTNENCSKNIKDFNKKVSVIRKNYEIFYVLSDFSKRVINNILSAYFGNNIPEIGYTCPISLNNYDNFTNYPEIDKETFTIQVNVFDYKNREKSLIYQLISKLNDMKKNSTSSNIELFLHIEDKELLRLNINIESNTIKINLSNNYSKNSIICDYKNIILCYVAWISKNIKNLKLEEQIEMHDYTNILHNIVIDNIESIKNEITMQELCDNMDLEENLNSEMENRDRQLNDLTNQINMLNDRYDLSIKRLTEYCSNFKNMIEQTTKTINYHLNKTKYLHDYPTIINNDGKLWVSIRTNILPVLNMDNVATYIKNYGYWFNSKQLEMIEKIKNGEAFLAVAPTEYTVQYYINTRREYSRKFNIRRGDYDISYNCHATISSGQGCLGTYVNTFREAAQDLDTNKTIINVINYLQSISPLDAAGRNSFKDLLVLDEFGEKIIYSVHESLIGKTREEVSKEIWQKYES